MVELYGYDEITTLMEDLKLGLGARTQRLVYWLICVIATVRDVICVWKDDSGHI